MSERHCVECGTQLVIHPQAPPKKYCGRQCKYQAQERRRPRSRKTVANPVCIVCGGPFPQTRKQLGGTPRAYCSTRCRYRLQKSKRTGRSVSPRTACEQCGEPINGIVTKRFCSNRCRMTVRRSKKPRRRCKDCGKPLQVGVPSSQRFCPPCSDLHYEARRRRLQLDQPDLSAYQPNEADAIAAFLANKGVTRIENGQWPDTGREGVRSWKTASAKRGNEKSQLTHR